MERDEMNSVQRDSKMIKTNGKQQQKSLVVFSFMQKPMLHHTSHFKILLA